MFSASSVQKLIDAPYASQAREQRGGVEALGDDVADDQQRQAARRLHRAPHRGERALDRWQHAMADAADAEDDRHGHADEQHDDQHHHHDLVGVDAAEVDRVGREPDGEEQQPDLHDDLRHGAEDPAGRDRRRRGRGRSSGGTAPAARCRPPPGPRGWRSYIADCSSMLGHTGRRMGTLPRNVMPKATSVAMPSTNAERDEPPVGVLHRVPEHLRVADPAEQDADPHQRAHRHQQAAGLHPVEPAELGRVGGRRRGSDGAELVEAVVELVAPAERVVGPARERGGLEHRERGGHRLLAHDPHRGGDRAFGTDDRGGGREQLRDVARGLTEPRAARREVEADDAHRPGRAGAVDEHVAGVELAVGDAAPRGACAARSTRRRADRRTPRRASRS